MEIEQPVVRINPLEDILDAETLAADMLHQRLLFSYTDFIISLTSRGDSLPSSLR